jgi:hypothetical protein
MQYYFDESGDTGKPEKSVTNFFVIVVYKEENKEITKLIEDKIRKDLRLSSKSILKWNKTEIGRKIPR